MMLNFVLFLFCLILLNEAAAVKAPQCSGLNISLNTTDLTSNSVLLTFSTQLTLVTHPPKKYFNILTVSNYSSHSFDSSASQAGPLRFWDGNEGIMIYCPSMSDPCNITIPDGVGLLEVPIFVKGGNEFPELLDDINFDHGTVYISQNGLYFEPNIRDCMEFEEYGQNTPNILFITKICCNQYSYIDIPDPTDNPCTEFESQTIFTLQNTNTTISTFSAKYTYSPTQIAITVTDYTGPSTGSYYFSPNEDLIYCADKKPGCSLTQPLQNSSEDFHFDMELDVWDPYPQTYHYDAMSGQLIRRRGVLLHDQNIQFTVQNPCWSRIAPGNNNSIATSSFCCTKFEKPASSNCQYYTSITNVTEGNQTFASLEVQYKFLPASINVTMSNFIAINATTASLELYSNKTFSNSCM